MRLAIDTCAQFDFQGAESDMKLWSKRLQSRIWEKPSAEPFLEISFWFQNLRGQLGSVNAKRKIAPYLEHGI